MTPDAPDPSLGALERVPCPACAEPVLPAARKCRWCGEWFGELVSMRDDRLRSVRLEDANSKLDGSPIRAATREPAVAAVDEITAAMLHVDKIALELGPGLTSLANPDEVGTLFERLKDVRRRIALEFGVIAPGVMSRPHAYLDPGGYQIRICGDLVAEGHVLLDHVMAVGQERDERDVDLQTFSISGGRIEHVVDPIYSAPAVWIPKSHEQEALDHGLQTFDAQDVVATHVAEVVKQHLAELLTREEVAELLNMARQDSPMVVQELVPNMLAIGQLRQVLQNLVREQIPVKDLSTILNALADNAVYTKDPHTLTEHVRQALGRRICSRYQSPDGMLRAFMLSPDAERAIQNAIQLNETGQVLMLDPTTSQAIQNNLAEALGRHRGSILDPVVVVPPKIRRHVKALLERHFAKIVVLSYSEIVMGVQVENLGMIEARPAGIPTVDASSSGSPVAVDQGSAHPGGDWLMEPDPDAPIEFRPADPNDDAMDWNW